MRQRDIILLPFPFSDLTGEKVRPALIISNDEFNSGEDIVVCAITTNTSRAKYRINISSRNLKRGTLHSASAIRAESIVKIKKTLAIKTIAAIDEATHESVQQALRTLFSRSI